MKSGGYWNGLISVEITGAEPEKTLYDLNRAGMRLYDVSWTDMITVKFFCARRDYGKIKEFCEKRGEKVRIGSSAGLGLGKTFIMRRPVLALGLILLLSLTFFLPTRILFFRVEGNNRIPSRQILEAMEECGIRFGTSRREIRSEKMKNALLESMPELKWAGINTSGCTAVISVREREIQNKQKDISGISAIVAATDGYLTSCTVVKGTGLCEPGQTVKAGQMLISGYTDHGICIQATGAEGEIFAQTKRTIEVVSPVQQLKRVEPLARTRRFSLILGKKRINLWKDSRISDATCGRMYEEYYMTLPGGFQLPVRFGIETLTQWKTTESEWIAPDMEENLKVDARCMVLGQTIAGKILRENHVFSQSDGCYGISSQFLCEEMISRVIVEEIGDTNGKTD